jgi:hypothetical protein
LPGINGGHVVNCGSLKIVVLGVETADEVIEPEGGLPDVEKEFASGTIHVNSAHAINSRVELFMPATPAGELARADLHDM